MSNFKNLKFYSQDEQQILEVVNIFKKLGYRVVNGYFNINSAKENGGVCVWDDGEITSGWLTDDDFEQITLEDLKEMVDQCDKYNKFTLERLLGCEVKVKTNVKGVTAYVVDHVIAGNTLHVKSGKHHYFVNINDLTFFTEDGDELAFDEYVNMYYGDSCV